MVRTSCTAVSLASISPSRFVIVVKQRMQVHGSIYNSVSECFRSVYRAEGLSAFYVSYPTTLTMTVPFTAVQFSTYEFLKSVPSLFCARLRL